MDSQHRTYRDGGGPLGLDFALELVRCSIPRLTADGILFIYTGTPVIDGADRFRLSLEQMLPFNVSIDVYDEIDPDVFGEELDGNAYKAVDRIAAVAAMIVKRL